MNKPFVLKNHQKLLFSFILIIVVVVVGAWFWHRQTVYPSTNDAYVKANLIYIAPQVDGKVAKVFVNNHQIVKAGQLLLTIDPKKYQYAVNQAEAKLSLQLAQLQANQEQVKVAQAKLQEVQAKAAVAQSKGERIAALSAKDFASKELYDETQGNIAIAKAVVSSAQEAILQAQQNLLVQKMQVKVAQAQLAQARLNLEHTKIYAPKSGVVSHFSLRPGAFVAVGQSQFVLVATDTWWIDANYKETDLARIRPGQKATIKLDLYPGHVFHGVVQSISRGSGTTFALLPAENATGNWVKVTQRFPVKITISDSELNKHYPLRVGASASVTINTKAGR